MDGILWVDNLLVPCVLSAFFAIVQPEYRAHKDIIQFLGKHRVQYVRMDTIVCLANSQSPVRREHILLMVPFGHLTARCALSDHSHRRMDLQFVCHAQLDTSARTRYPQILVLREHFPLKVSVCVSLVQRVHIV